MRKKRLHVQARTASKGKAVMLLRNRERMKSFTCALCERRFNSKPIFHKHMSNHRTSEKQVTLKILSNRSKSLKERESVADSTLSVDSCDATPGTATEKCEIDSFSRQLENKRQDESTALEDHLAQNGG